MSVSPRFSDINLDDVESIRSKTVPDLSMSVGNVPTLANGTNIRMAQQMTIAGSFLDFALFVADVEHLKFLLDSGKENVKYYTLLIVLLLTSLVLQLIVVFLLFFVGFKNPKPNLPQIEEVNEDGDVHASSSKTKLTRSEETNKRLQLINHVIICLVTLIAIVNVFVTVFGDRSETTLMAKYKADMAKYNHTFTDLN